MVAGCSSANPAFDEVDLGDTEGVVATSTRGGDTVEPGETTMPGDTGVPPFGTCSPESDFPLVFNLRDGQNLDPRRCGDTMMLGACNFSMIDVATWSLTDCTPDDGSLAPGPYTIEFELPPNLGPDPSFRAHVVIASKSQADGCKLEWAYIEAPPAVNGEPPILVWAGTNTIDTPLQFPLTAMSEGPTMDCECGGAADPCDEAYGPQRLAICYEGFVCGSFTLEDGETSVDVTDRTYGVVVLHAWEPEDDDFPGEYRYVVRLTSPLG
jgi:hypothetical protein